MNRKRMINIIPAIALMAMLGFSGTAVADNHNPCNPCDIKSMEKHNPCDMGKNPNPCDMKEMKDMKNSKKHGNPCDTGSMDMMKSNNPCSQH